MSTTRIAYFIDHLKVGGAQKHLIDVLKGLDRTRFSPEVWTLKGEGELIPEVEQLGVPAKNVGLGRRLLQMRSIKQIMQVALEARRTRIDIIHCYLSFANVVGTLAGNLARVPVVLVSKRSLDNYDRRIELWGQKLANALADRVVANAYAVRDFVVETEGCRADKIAVIPNGIKESSVGTGSSQLDRACLGLTEEDRVVGTVGRLAWKKGYPYLLESASRVLREVPEAVFVIVGDGPLALGLKQEAQRLGIDSRVRFLGQRLDAREIMALSDIFVLSSVIEGMSNALLETMALGKPVVVTDVGGNAEVVLNTATGFVVPPRDPEEMSRAIISLLKDRSLALQIGKAGQERVRQSFSFSRTLHDIESMYQEMLSAKSWAT